MLKSIEYPIEDGDDQGKIFIIERMPLFTADKWARYLIKALAEAGEKLLESVLKYPVRETTDLALILFGKMKLSDLERSFETLLRCCKVQDSVNKNYREIVSEDIEDPMTLTCLRTKALELHRDYLQASYLQLMPLNVIFGLSSKEANED
ncbi:hypothetical protein RF55_13472 [Lasius niger]|uniref:Uncharacterized protein n=1 Tax=Lasius niger TaxID=67767 RepID=A0A0J7KA10_LASNI|nr:hypothetical protein RF55_13472 [Lasius niger]